MRAIEIAAGAEFRRIGMDAVADDPPPTDAELALAVGEGSAWVYADEDDTPIAYLLVERLDNRAHIEQVTVHPTHARRGIGAALIEHAARWAAREGLQGLSLTTFADVPWNAPYYSRLGFNALPETEWKSGIRDRWARETAHGLNAWPRVMMVREGRSPAD